MLRFIERLSPRKREWMWFIILWCGGLMAILLLSAIIKLLVLVI